MKNKKLKEKIRIKLEIWSFGFKSSNHDLSIKEYRRRKVSSRKKTFRNSHPYVELKIKKSLCYFKSLLSLFQQKLSIFNKVLMQEEVFCF